METKAMSLFLKELRKERGLTQEQAAEALFVSPKTVSRWETGATIPDLETLLQLAEFYQVDVKELIDGRRFGPDEAPDAAAREKSALHAAAEYSSHKEKRSVRRTVLTLLAVFLAIAGIYAFFRWRNFNKSLDTTGFRQLYGRVTDYTPSEEDGSYLLRLEGDFDDYVIRVLPTTFVNGEGLRERLDAGQKDLLIWVDSEYSARDEYTAKKRGEQMIWPAYCIGSWKP